eukprot:Skav226997  [mRNA]  locus=scaffold4219:96414:107108:- [translate_table: standard]
MADASLTSAEAIMADAKAQLETERSQRGAVGDGWRSRSEALVGYEASKPTQMSGALVAPSPDASEALALAKEALVSFRRAGDKKKVAALKVVVDANMAMDRSFDAMMAVVAVTAEASDELAMIKRTGDKQAEVDVAEMLAEAGEAQMLLLLANLKQRGGRNKEALSLAQQALGLFKELVSDEVEQGGAGELEDRRLPADHQQGLRRKRRDGKGAQPQRRAEGPGGANRETATGRC